MSSPFDNLPDVPDLDSLPKPHETGTWKEEGAPVSALVNGVTVALVVAGAAAMAGLAFGAPLIVGIGGGIAAAMGIGAKALDLRANGRRVPAMVGSILAAGALAAGIGVGLYKEARPAKTVELKEAFEGACAGNGYVEKKSAKITITLPKGCNVSR